MKNLKRKLMSGIILTTLLGTQTISIQASTMGTGSNVENYLQRSENLESNIVQNGDFKEGLDYWTPVSFEGGEISIKTEVNENYVELSDPFDNSGSAILQYFFTSQLRKYNISFWYKGSDNGKFIYQVSGGAIPDEPHIFELTDSQENWKEYKGIIEIPQDDWVIWNKLGIGFVSGEDGDRGSINPLRIKNVNLTEIKNQK